MPNLGRNKDNNYNSDKCGPLEMMDPLHPHTLNALYMEKKEEDREAITYKGFERWYGGI